MQLGKVIGNVVSTHKEESLEGMKFLIVQPLDASMKEISNPLVAIDGVGAGQDEVILFATGSSARQTELTHNKPADAIIMGIVDSFAVDGKNIFSK